ncbi:MAG: hypothetical protein R2715_11625 [Ilumatobacteraceae bacterium]
MQGAAVALLYSNARDAGRRTPAVARREQTSLIRRALARRAEVVDQP